MTKYKPGDALPAEDITDDLIGAKVGFDYTGGRMGGVITRVTQAETLTRLHLGDCTSGCVIRSTVEVMILTSPPVKVIQPPEPTAPGTLVRIEGVDDWYAVLAGDLGERNKYWINYDVHQGWVGWEDIISQAAGRQIIVSSAPEFPDTEPPETITEWPEDDEPLRDWRWQDEDDYEIGYRDGAWCYWSPSQGAWRSWHPNVSLPLTRVGRA